ncbi:MAG: Uma2 family endonuclease [Burkholderiales bacterium]|nr:Uma2 family endonuclease [Anaerolineae bacterium]
MDAILNVTIEKATEHQVKQIYTGKVVAEDVPYEKFLTDFDGRFVEWIFGVVIELSVNEQHDALNRFLGAFFDTYVGLTTGRRITQEPLVMKVSPDLPTRAPDLLVLLPESLHKLKQSQVVGAADLVVEIVSPESQHRDRVEKFQEYEQGGVREYWLLDYLAKDAKFFVLNEDGVFEQRLMDEYGVYHSLVLERMHFTIEWLWHDPVLRVYEVVALVQAMLNEDN